MTIGSTLVAAKAVAANSVAAASAVDATPRPFMLTCRIPRFLQISTSVVKARSAKARGYSKSTPRAKIDARLRTQIAKKRKVSSMGAQEARWTSLDTALLCSER